MRKTSLVILAIIFCSVTIQCTKTSNHSVPSSQVEVDERLIYTQRFLRERMGLLSNAGVNYLQNLPKTESECDLDENDIDGLQQTLLSNLEQSISTEYEDLYSTLSDSIGSSLSSYIWNPVFDEESSEILDASLPSKVLERLNSVMGEVAALGSDFIDSHENTQTDFDEDDFAQDLQTLVSSKIEEISEDEELTSDEKLALLAGLESLNGLAPVICTALGENLDCIYDGWSEPNQRRFWQKVGNFVRATVNVVAHVVVSAVKTVFNVYSAGIAVVACGGFNSPCLATAAVVGAAFGGVVGLVNGINDAISGCYKYCFFRCSRKPSCPL